MKAVALALVLASPPSAARAADSPELKNVAAYEYSESDVASILALAAELGIDDPAVVVFERCRGGCAAVPCTDVFVEVASRAELSQTRRRTQLLTIGHIDETCEFCRTLPDLRERDGWVTTARALRTVEQSLFTGDGWQADVVLAEDVDRETAATILGALHAGEYTMAGGELEEAADKSYFHGFIQSIFDPMDRWTLTRGSCTPNHSSGFSNGLEDASDCYRLDTKSRDGRSGSTVILALEDDGLLIGYGIIGWVRC